MESYEIGTGALTAGVLEIGAELCSLHDAKGREFLWQAGPTWPRHAPNLFPIVGRLKDDRLRHGGKEYHLTQHGFARDRRFAWLSRQKTSCSLELRDRRGEPRNLSFRLPPHPRLRGRGRCATHQLHP